MLLSLSFISYKIYTESILRDGSSDGIGVKWKAISLKSAFGSWKLTVRLKVYTSWWVKIRRSQRNTLKISTLERRRLLLNSLHFFLEGKKLIKKSNQLISGVQLYRIVTGRKKLDRVLVRKEFIEHNGPKSSVWQTINVNGFSKG